MVVGHDLIINVSLPRASTEDHRALQILLHRVKQFWIEGVLKRSVRNAALLALGKDPLEDAVASPWAEIPGLPGQPEKDLPAGKRILEIFDAASRALLILGEPGSGKTSTLLELTRDLIARAEADPTQAIPVVFHLSTWRKQHRSLYEWLVTELAEKYYVAPATGRSWLRDNRLLLLLDGLDEVRPDSQATCIEAINAFIKEYGIPGVAVCSRFAEYTRLPIRLNLAGAICLQPLTDEQINAYLDDAGSRLSALRTTLRHDPPLQRLAQSPLMLNIMTVAYLDMSAEELAGERLETIEARRAHAFNSYVNRMFTHRGKGKQPFARERTESWLSWLAREMLRHSQTMFLIERLQPSWIRSRSGRFLYVLTSRLLGSILLWLLFMLSLMSVMAARSELGLEAIGLTIVAIGFGLLGGITTAVVDAYWLESRARRESAKPPTAAAILVLYTIIFGTMIGLIIGSDQGLVPGISWGLIGGLFFGGAHGALFGFRMRRQTLAGDIQTVEALTWSLSRAKSQSIRGIRFGGMIWIGTWAILWPIFFLTGLANHMAGDLFSAFLLTGLLTVGTGGLIGAIFGGLVGSVVETTTSPNQGIRLSLRNAGVAGGIIGGIGAAMKVIFWTGEMLLTGSSGESILSVGSGVLFWGLLAGLWYGLLDVVQHYTLRFLLYRMGCIPRDYAKFLDYGVKLVFLQKVGGGYIFIHRFLQDHFAQLHDV